MQLSQGIPPFLLLFLWQRIYIFSLFLIQESVAPNESLKKSKSKHSKTIIDAFTALTQSEMRAQMQIQINVTAKLRKIRAKVKWNNGGNFNGRKHYEKLLPSAKQLLTTLQHK